MEFKEIAVTKSEQFATFRQVVTPKKLEIPGTLLTLHDILSKQKFGGKMIVNYQQGGVTNIITEQVAEVKEGSAADRILESEFAK